MTEIKWERVKILLDCCDKAREWLTHDLARGDDSLDGLKRRGDLMSLTSYEAQIDAVCAVTGLGLPDLRAGVKSLEVEPRPCASCKIKTSASELQEFGGSCHHCVQWGAYCATLVRRRPTTFVGVDLGKELEVEPVMVDVTDSPLVKAMGPDPKEQTWADEPLVPEVASTLVDDLVDFLDRQARHPSAKVRGLERKLREFLRTAPLLFGKGEPNAMRVGDMLEEIGAAAAEYEDSDRLTQSKKADKPEG